MNCSQRIATTAIRRLCDYCRLFATMSVHRTPWVLPSGYVANKTKPSTASAVQQPTAMRMLRRTWRTYLNRSPLQLPPPEGEGQNTSNDEEEKNNKNTTHDGCGLWPYVPSLHSCAREHALAQTASPPRFGSQTEPS